MVNKQINLGIDARSLAGQKKGVGQYLYNLLYAFSKSGKEINIFLYSNKDFDLPGWATGFVKRIGSGPLSLNGTLWMQVVAPILALDDKIDVFWGIEGILPLKLSDNIVQIITIHDLVSIFYPKTMGSWNLFVHALFFKRSLMKAKNIIVISKQIKNELAQLFPTMSHKLKLVYSGTNVQIQPKDKTIAREYVAHKFNICSKFILFVGTLEPRKNLALLLKAARIMRTEHPSIDVKLVIVGAKGWKDSSFAGDLIKMEKEGLASALGYVSNEDLSYLYSAASVFVLPSLYEGFGLPILEAMKCGAPLLLSDIPVFKEIAGDTAEYFDGNDGISLAAKLFQLLNNPISIDRISEKTEKLLDKFDWNRSAEDYLSILIFGLEDKNKTGAIR